MQYFPKYLKQNYRTLLYLFLFAGYCRFKQSRFFMGGNEINPRDFWLEVK